MTDTIWQDIPYALVPRWVVQALGLDRSAVAVYTALAAYASRPRRAYPGIRRIAKDLNCSQVTVQRALRRLEAAGAVRVERRVGEKGNRQSNIYHLPADPMEAVLAAALRAVDKPVDKSGGVCSLRVQGVSASDTEQDN